MDFQSKGGSHVALSSQTAPLAVSWLADAIEKCLAVVVGSFLIGWVCRIAANDCHGQSASQFLQTFRLPLSRMIVGRSTYLAAVNWEPHHRKSRELSLFIAGSPHAAFLLLLSSSTVKVAPFLMTASMGSSNHMFFSPLVQFRSSLQKTRCGCLTCVRLARVRNAAVEPDRSVFNRKQRIVTSMLSLAVNMIFAQPLEHLS